MVEQGERGEPGPEKAEFVAELGETVERDTVDVEVVGKDEPTATGSEPQYRTAMPELQPPVTDVHYRLTKSK